MRFDDDPLWRELVGALGSIGQVEDREPSGLVVTARYVGSTPTVVEVVMTPDEWDDLVSIPWGQAVEAAAQHVRQLVLDQPREQRFLVYGQYELVPCDRPNLPVDPAFERMRELAAQHPDGVIPGGRWTANQPDDNPPA